MTTQTTDKTKSKESKIEAFLNEFGESIKNIPDFYKAIFVFIAIIAGYILFSFGNKMDSRKRLEELLHEHVNKSIKVETVSLDGLYIFSDLRNGVALLTCNGKQAQLNFTVTGNGVWDDSFISIEGSEQMKLKMIGM
ncbi:MAG: hypothetical protein JXR48_10130 [Candidatus Delongbacteria bacterium]|nr:hypothetical protein [Candidatus Delongbacteria bacterium]MBN2835312.1 hypothetical protein [Candidatus Delongbacteria bacterium]